MTKTDHEDSNLLAQKASRGDRVAFSELVQRHMNAVVALTYRMTGDRDTALDLAQESFVSAWENLARFRGDAKFESWVYRIAVNKCLNHLEGRKSVSLDTIPEEHLTSSDNDAADQRLAREELRQGVLAFMATLPPQQRAVFELRFYRQMSFEEIAQATERALGTVKTNYREAVQKLRAHAQSSGWHA